MGLGLFGGGNSWTNPADAAMPYLDQIKGQMSKYLDPYFNAGKSALDMTQGQYGKLINDPTFMMNQIGKGYQASPGYQWQVGQATNAANNAAQAGGMVGSPQEQQELAGTVNGLANQDYYNYLNQALGQYQQGLGGMQDISHMGLNAGTSMAENLAQMLMSMANMSYAGAQNSNMHGGGGIISKAISGIF